MTLFFVLGREPALSIAEVFSVLKRELGPTASAKAAKTTTVSREILLADLPENLDPRALMSILGGTIKIGHALQKIHSDSPPEQLSREILKIVRHIPAYAALDRVHFGISVYATHPAAQSKTQLLQNQLKRIGMETKQLLKKDGKSARWVTSRAPSLSSVVVETNKLLKEGTEVVLLVGQDKISIGHTVAVQPFRDLERRDFPRPGRDPKSGMLPPKLARMMVNLAAAPRDGILLDPFCGSGTVLGEALLLGYNKLMGGDIDALAVRNTNRNLDWLVRSGLAPKTAMARNIKLFQSDIRDLGQHIAPNSIDAIVTETYLGPPLTGRESRVELEKIRAELTPLFRDSLTVIARLLKKDGRAVIAFPLLRYKKEVHPAPVLNELKSFGWQLVSPLPTKFSAVLRTELGRNGNTLIYGRPDQKVWREIAILEPLI